MGEYIRIKAIEALKDRLEFGGGVAAGEPPIVASQAEYLSALSNGIPLDLLKLRRIVPVALYLDDEQEADAFQQLASVFINELAPALDLEFISCPYAEAGSVGWNPATRTKKRYTAAEFLEWQRKLEEECKVATDIVSRGDDVRQLYEGLETALFSQVFRAKNELYDAESKLTQPRKESDPRSIQIDLTYYDEKKSTYELLKAKYEMEKARYESETAKVSALEKLVKLLLSVGCSALVLIGGVQITSIKTPVDHHSDKTVQIQQKNPKESHQIWTRKAAEVLKELAEAIDTGSSEDK